MEVRKCGLSGAELLRYARHLILESFGSEAQERVCRGSCLVIGAGGLGSSAILYLAAAGVGRIGIVDGDVVDESNLQRQVIHSQAAAAAGVFKAESAKEACLRLNPLVEVDVYCERFNSSNAESIASKYDVIVDASDNVPTRYLASDVSIMLKKPLVSGSALRTEGQLTVYNAKVTSGVLGPCYRCVFPSPPAREFVTDCSDGGVLGPVPGIIGCMQATEALKLLGQVGEVLDSRMLVMDAMDWTVRVFKMKGKNAACVACSKDTKGLNPKEFDYVNFTKSELHDGLPEKKSELEEKTLVEIKSVSCTDYCKDVLPSVPHLLLDVRESVQFKICSLGNAINLPISQLKKKLDVVKDLAGEKPIYVICRRGRFSVQATKILMEHGFLDVQNIEGGYAALHSTVDESFPTY